MHLMQLTSLLDLTEVRSFCAFFGGFLLFVKREFWWVWGQKRALWACPQGTVASCAMEAASLGRQKLRDFPEQMASSGNDSLFVQ
jgi:hypothetical protein